MAQQTDVATTPERPTAMQGLVAGWLTRNEAAIRLPAHIQVDRLRWETYMAIRKNPALEKCDPTSLLNAILQIASYGLYPGPLAHLVPFGSEVVAIIDYKGMVELIVAGGAKKVESRIVRPGDEFTVTLGINPSIHHISKGGSGMGWSHVYAIVWLANGETQFEVMDKAEVMKIKERSPSMKGGRNTPWRTDEEAMALKTVTRRVAKYVPRLTQQLSAAIEFEDSMDVTGQIPRGELDAKLIAPVPDAPLPPPLDPEELRKGLQGLGLADEDEMPSAGARAASGQVDPETGELLDPSPSCLVVCPKHDVGWIDGLHGPYHGIQDGPICGQKTLLAEYKKEVVATKGMTKKEDQDWMKYHWGATFSQLDSERQVRAINGLRRELGEALLSLG